MLRAAADSLARGARAVEETDVEGAMTLLFDALDIYENEAQEANAQDIFRSGWGGHVLAGMQACRTST